MSMWKRTKILFSIPKGYFSLSKSKTYDYLVIGAGSGGIASARRAAMFNKKVAVFETNKLGGTCVNVGCVPKKVTYGISDFHEAVRLMNNGYGFDIKETNFNMKKFKEARDAYIARLNKIYKTNLDNSKVDHIQGRAQFLDNNTVKCNDEIYQAEHICIATGSWPRKLGFPGEEHTITSNEFFSLEEIPKRTLIVGGGYIATELGQILSSLGSDTTMLVRRCLLSTFDQELAGYQMDNLEKCGVGFVCGEIKHIEKESNGVLTVTRKDGKTHQYDCVLMAVGRAGNIHGLQLDNTDVEYNSSHIIKTDEYENTTAKGVYAVGDVNGKIALTPVAIRAGRVLAERLFNNRPSLKVDYHNVPSVIFSHPPIGSIGLSEEAASKKYGSDKLTIYRSNFTSMHYALANDDSLKHSSFFKMICLKEANEKVIGFHAVGLGADEMLQGIAVAIKAGATKADFDQTIAIHPTSSEEVVLLDPKLH